jgi:hypothetical protein
MSATLGNAIISYDLNTAHIAVKQAMIDRGYLDHCTLNNLTYDLPNTTLWRRNTSTGQILSDLQDCARVNRATIQRSVAVLGTDWAGYPAR